MATEFTDEQVGKRVVSQTGEEIGTVSSVSDGDLHVTVDGDVDDDLADELGWGGAVEQDTNRLEREYVADVEEESVRLRI
ncbi:hypothetical protein [Halomarina ordinaria]|uniref:PRC-barrel domain containing protein n=1 Tax=Halomarina ordinaria TaxID=3033939 RepID=A0ABD5U8Q0_9EURY|nr:hypothetical protein [Halomarina sp. PSRA2]